MTTENNDSTDQIEAMVAFGQVVNVRPIPTRQVTQIVIEIPDDHHIAATTMLFGKNAFVLAANPKTSTPFGVVPLSKMNDTQAPAEQKQESGSRAGYRQGGLTTNVNPTQWLGIQCQSAMFMSWIRAKDAQEAAATVRRICGVDSRADIARSEDALQRFMSEVYTPYNAYARQAEQDIRRVTSATT